MRSRRRMVDSPELSTFILINILVQEGIELTHSIVRWSSSMSENSSGDKKPLTS